jgi:hypothetical protein
MITMHPSENSGSTVDLKPRFNDRVRRVSARNRDEIARVSLDQRIR